MRSVLKGIFVVGLAVAGAQSFAQPGITHPSESELRAPTTSKGLCTSDNKESQFYQTYCLAIKEQLGKPCSQDLIKKMRDRFLNQQAANDPRTFGGFGHLACPGEHQALKKNPQSFETILMEMMAAIAISQSGQREYANLSNAARADNSGKQGGLFNLKEEWIKDEKYECGCKNINSTGEGKDLTVNDAPLQATCATFIALYWAEKHGTFLNGGNKNIAKNCQHANNQDPDYSGPVGAACIFENLRETDPPNPPPPFDPNREKNNPELNFVHRKIKTWCEKNITPNGDMRVNPFTNPDPRNFPSTID